MTTPSETPATDLSRPSWLRPLWHRKLAQDIDAICQTDLHLDGAALMETAGRHLGQIALEEWANSEIEGPVVVLCGSGNNGGDGLVAARFLNGYGVPVSCYFVCEDSLKISRLCRRQHSTWLALGLPLMDYKPGVLKEQHGANPILGLDAIWGIGFQPPLRPDALGTKALQELGELNLVGVVAADVPSGMAVDLFEQQTPPPLPATITVTFGDLKPAQVVSPGRTVCGALEVADIGFPVQARTLAISGEPEQLLYADPDQLLGDDPWQDLPDDIHKYDRGHVLVMGGSRGKSGAPTLAALSALRTGAGWASLALSPAAKGQYQQALDLTEEEFFIDEQEVDSKALGEFLGARRVKSVIVGPGMRASPINRDLLETLAAWDGFCLFDAGALHGLADQVSRVSKAPKAGHWLATPHPGEWQKMGFMQKQLSNLEDLAKAHEEARMLGLTVLYKSATPLIFGASIATPAVTDAGHSGLAKAGSGDVLCGIIAAHGALRPEALFAGLRGYSELGRISELVAEKIGVHSLVASDLV